MDQKRILVVEDEANLANSIKLLLTMENYQVDWAPDGKKGQELIRLNSYDLVISDMVMPKVGGMELIRWFKENRIEVPILVITGYGDKTMLLEMMEMGYSNYLDKPFDDELLIQKVNAIFKREEKKKLDMELIKEKFEQTHTQLNQELERYQIDYQHLFQQLLEAQFEYEELMTPKDTKCPLAYHYKKRMVARLGGDCFFIHPTQNGCDLLIADVAGHDMSASFHTLIVKTLFEINVRLGNKGFRFFNHLNQHLIQNGKSPRMITAQMFQFNFNTHQVQITTAGHPYAILIKPGSKMPEFVELVGSVLGIFDDVSFDSDSLIIQPGYRFIFYSDGIIEMSRQDPDSSASIKLGPEGLISILKDKIHLPLEEMIDQLWVDLYQFSNGHYEDDCLLVGVEVPLMDTLGVFRGNLS